MDRLPTPDETRALIAPLDDLDRKVLGGLVALWIAAPDRVRDREWTAEQFVHLATVAHGFAGDGPATTDDVERIRTYAQRRLEALVRIAFALFVRIADDLRPRGAEATFADAQAAIARYL